MHLLEDVQAMLPGTDLMVVTSKADLLDPLPDMWTEVSEAEAEWRDDGAEGTPDLPLLLDPKGRVTMSATEFIGMDAMRMEIKKK